MTADAKWNPQALASASGVKTVWKVELGNGYSAVSIANGKVYTMGNRDNTDFVYCLDLATGAEKWKQSYSCKGGDYPGPRATPFIDGKVLYTVSYQGQVHCLDANTGAVKWMKDMASELKAQPPGWGHAASPVVEGKMLLLNACRSGVALDKNTGAVIWASDADKCGYATPVVHENKGKKCVAIFGAKALYDVDLLSGSVLWSYKWETSYDVNAADPIIISGTRAFISSGYDRGCVLLDFAAGEAKPVWQNTLMRNHFSTCILYKDNIYGVDGSPGGGSLRCLSGATGAELWQQRLGFGSLIAAGDKLVVLNEKGRLFVAEAAPEAYKELASADTAVGGTFWTAPVLSGDKLFCRNSSGTLVCIDVSK